MPTFDEQGDDGFHCLPGRTNFEPPEQRVVVETRRSGRSTSSPFVDDGARAPLGRQAPLQATSGRLVSQPGRPLTFGSSISDLGLHEVAHPLVLTGDPCLMGRAAIKFHVRELVPPQRDRGVSEPGSMQ